MDEKDLDQIEKLLSLSVRGCHHLFDNSEIARVLAKPTEDLDFFSINNMERIQSLFIALIQKNSLAEKQQFLASLDEESREILLRTYFHIVDNSALATSRLRH
ncbi:MAG: hypothetical protein KDD61_17965 [Bdellovibrionales bacterium]|nr:hypothetical protein [Bdellovibrionales bacterium]